MPSCVETENGFSIIGSGEPNSSNLKEVVVLVDLKKGIALWSGSRELVEQRFESLRNRCKGVGIVEEFESYIRLLSLPGDVSIDEMNWMMQRLLIPRRVSMRLKNGKS
jgi:hypothetical protein